MDEVSKIKKIGNFIASFLLGNTRDVISRIDTKTERIEKDLDDSIKPDLKDVRERFGKVEDRVETLWRTRVSNANSPVQLNERGKDILEKSGIKAIIDDKKPKLFEKIKEKNPTNAYDAEEIVLDIVRELPEHCPEIVSELKRGAFDVGEDLDTVLYVGGMHLRNEVFPELGYELKQIDEYKKRK